MRRTVSILAAVACVGLLSPATFAEPPCAIVTMGGADIDYPPGEGPPTYRGTNLSLIARLGCDGTVKGQFQDTLLDGIGVHAEVTCLEIDADSSLQLTRPAPPPSVPRGSRRRVRIASFGFRSLTAFLL